MLGGLFTIADDAVMAIARSSGSGGVFSAMKGAAKGVGKLTIGGAPGRMALGAAIGGIGGYASSDYQDPGNRLRSAFRGAVGGAAIGGLSRLVTPAITFKKGMPKLVGFTSEKGKLKQILEQTTETNVSWAKTLEKRAAARSELKPVRQKGFVGPLNKYEAHMESRGGILKPSKEVYGPITKSQSYANLYKKKYGEVPGVEGPLTQGRSAIRDMKSNIGTIAGNIFKSVVGFPLNHPFLTAGVIGGGLATSSLIDERYIQSRSDLQRDEGRLQRMQGSSIGQNTIGTGSQRILMESTNGLVEGLHSRRH